MKINVGFLLAYDYELLRIAIPLVYKSADKIVLALDENLKTWSGNTFEISQDFFNWIEEFDSEKKLSIYQDNFYVKELSPMENETRERQMLAEKMGEGLCLQIDADEFFLDFDGLVNFLKKSEKKLKKNTLNVCGMWLTIFKKVDGGYLLIKEISPFYLGSTKPKFTHARKNKGQEKWYIPFIALHQSWGRTEDEIYKKISNWGHSKDFDVDKYMSLWKSINKENYRQFRNLHPILKNEWRELIFMPGNSLEELIANEEFPTVDNFYIKRKNFGQFIKYLFKK